MNNTEFAELLLTRIYDLAEKNGHHTVVNFIDEAKKFGITDQGKVENIADYLKNRGLIDASFTVRWSTRFYNRKWCNFCRKRWRHRNYFKIPKCAEFVHRKH